jgi:hypothetical protein
MTSVRYLDKAVTTEERNLFSGWWKEQIAQYGTIVSYYTHGYSLSSHNCIYGEDPTSAFVNRGDVIMLTDITNDALMLSKFGITADCDMTALVHIGTFQAQLSAEPKSGDLLELKEFGGHGDRPGGRGAPIYEITERDDEYLQQTNALMGHYVWYIKCRRWERSYEPGVEGEPVNTQLSDSGAYGNLDDLEDVPYGNNIKQESDKIFNNDCTENDSPYGNY